MSYLYGIGREFFEKGCGYSEVLAYCGKFVETGKNSAGFTAEERKEILKGYRGPVEYPDTK